MTTQTKAKLTQNHIAEVLLQAEEMKQQSLLRALWNTFRAIFVITSAGATYAMEVGTIESSVGTTEYRARRLRELRAELAEA